MLRGKRAKMEPITSMDGDNHTTTKIIDAAIVERMAMRVLNRENTAELLDDFKSLLSNPTLNLLQVCQIFFNYENVKRPISNAVHKILAAAIAMRNEPNQFIQFFNDHEKYAAANYQLALLFRNCTDGNPDYIKQQALAALALALKKEYPAALEVSQRAKQKVLTRDEARPTTFVQGLSKRRRFPILSALVAQQRNAAEDTPGETKPAEKKPALILVPSVVPAAPPVPVQADASSEFAQADETKIPKGADLIERLACGELLIGASLFRFPSDLLPALELDGYQATLFAGYQPKPVEVVTAESVSSPSATVSESFDSYVGSSELSSEESVPSEESVDKTWVGILNTFT